MSFSNFCVVFRFFMTNFARKIIQDMAIYKNGDYSGSMNDGRVDCIDTIINTPKNCIYRSQSLSEGYYAFVHLRERKGKRMASSQHLTQFPK